MILKKVLDISEIIFSLVIIMVEMTTFFIIIIGFVFMMLFFIYISNPSNKSTLPQSLENFDTVGMTIHNHLNNCMLDIYVNNYNADGAVTKETHLVKFRDNHQIPLNILSRFCGNSVLTIYILPDKYPGKKIHMTDIQLNSPPGTIFNDLHIGTTTTRSIGETNEMQTSGTNQGVATLGGTFIRIHNTTRMPLSLNNGKIIVPPEDYTRFRGYEEMGVPLGMYFKDDEGLYSTYQLTSPYTDLYFGVISDNNQPLNGPFQFNFSTEVNGSSTLWPFVDGIM